MILGLCTMSLPAHAGHGKKAEKNKPAKAKEAELTTNNYRQMALFTGTVSADPNSGTTDGFGSAVKMNGDWAFVSAPIARPYDQVVGGAVYVYKKTRGQYSTEPTQIIAIPGPSHHLGLFSVESQGNWLFLSCLGTPVEDNGQTVGDFKGAVLIYKLNTRSGQWESFQKIDSSTEPGLANLVPISVEARDNPFLPPYDNQQGASFGITLSVDVNAGWMVVGAQYQTTDPSTLNVGRAYMFQFKNNKWKLTQTLINPDGVAANDTFGAQVALKGSLALVSNGSVFQGPKLDKGSVYVYQLVNGNWVFRQKVQGQQTTTTPVTFVLFLQDPVTNGVLPVADTFGSSLALTDDWALIGAAYESNGSPVVQGAAYFYKVNCNSNKPLKFSQKVTPTDVNPLSQNFSLTSVALDDGTAVISNICATGPTGIAFQGGASVYRLGRNNQWNLDRVLFNPNPVTESDAGTLTDTLFGGGVDVQGNQIFVGGGFPPLETVIVGTPPLAFLPVIGLPPLPNRPQLRSAVIYQVNCNE